MRPWMRIVISMRQRTPGSETPTSMTLQREVEEMERDGGRQEQPSGEEVGNDNDESEGHQEQHPTENTRKRDRKYDDKRSQE